MLEQFRQYLVEQNLSETTAQWIIRASSIVGIALLAALAFFLAKKIILGVIHALTRKTKTDWDNKLVQHRVFYWIAHLAPGLVIYLFAPAVFQGTSLNVILTAVQIYMVVVGLLAVDAVLNASLAIYNTFTVAREVPLKGFFQVGKIILYIVAVIVVLGMLLGKSPLYLLSGMGVLASVLMLVFKDPILGFVGGIQLSANRMLAKGDWIEMPKYNADGDVIDIALTTVKVQNWDKTITTIPTYALISDSFKNWRGMSDSGGRRIKRAVHIDIGSIKLCTPEMLERFAVIQHIAEHIASKEKEIAGWNKERGVDMSDPVNARQLTNIGTFRAYILAYLQNHPQINQDMTLLVRQLEPGPDGLPIQIYCFTKDKRWAVYEDIQSDIFDHILAVAPEFDLRIPQNPSGSDLRALSSLH